MSGSDLLSNLGLWDQKGQEKGKSGTAKTRTKAKAPAKTTAAKGKGKGKSVKEKETEADDESDISGIEILPDDGPIAAGPAKRKAPAKGKAATTSTIIKASPAKKGGKRKKADEGAVKFGMLRMSFCFWSL
jgi:septal ring-binding cell division protein DamX